MSDLQSGNSPERREVYFSGSVQGVGFRYTARNIAARFRVTGFVQNLNDGRVLLVVEGPTGEISELLKRLTTEMERHITGQQATTLPATEEFAEFSVRH